MDRSEWITNLAEVVRPNAPRAAANRLAKMLPLLESAPAWLFNERSLQFVAARCKQTPTYPQLNALLDAWRREFNDAHRIAPDREWPADMTDRVWAKTWLEPRADENGRLPSESDLIARLGRTRHIRPVAFQWLVANDANAASIAHRRNWISLEQWEATMRRDWDDPAGIRARIAKCDGNVQFLRLLASLVMKWAPQHIGWLPPQIIEAVMREAPLAARPHDSRPPSQPNYLTPEQLAAEGIRRNGIPGSTAQATSEAEQSSGGYPARDDIDGWPDPS